MEEKEEAKSNFRDEIIAIVIEALETAPELQRALKHAIKRLEQQGDLQH
ncbi:MAG: hypothetical protein AB7U64_23620 [Blastocatellales bacterium]